MNEHLDPIFKEVIPEIEKKKIDYWVIGGTAVAGIKGEFLRSTNDVDVFIKEENFNQAKIILKSLCKKHRGWTLKSYLPQCGKRPKIEIFKDTRPDKDLFSLIPVFVEENRVKFIFPHGGSKIFPADILIPVKRRIGKFEFDTPADKYVKELFYNHYNLLLQRHKGKEDESRHLRNYKIDKKFLDSLKIT